MHNPNADNIARVFPRRTNATPTDELAFVGGPPLWQVECDEVHVSVTFTWDKPRGEVLADQWCRQGYKVRIGGPAYGDRGEEFVAGRYVAPGYTITTRGCNNRCWFCYVPKREGRLRELPIVAGHDVLDSNVLQASRDHWEAVLGMLHGQSGQARFSGGLDARELSPWHVEGLAGLLPKPLIWLAYDTPDDWEHVCGAVAMLEYARFRTRKIMCYVLIGYQQDTMEAAESRLRQVVQLGITPFAMLYRGDDGKADPTWKPFQRRWCRPSATYAALNREVLDAQPQR